MFKPLVFSEPALSVGSVASAVAAVDPALVTIDKAVGMGDVDDAYTSRINAAHPMESESEYANYAYLKAMELVGNRHSKGALVDLVCWLIQRKGNDTLLHKDELSQNTAPLLKLHQVGFQCRYLCPEEGPSIWTNCDLQAALHVQGKPNYEIRAVYALPAPPEISHTHPKVEFDTWLKTQCFQQPTHEAYDLAYSAWLEKYRTYIQIPVGACGSLTCTTIAKVPEPEPEPAPKTVAKPKCVAHNWYNTSRIHNERVWRCKNCGSYEHPDD